MPLYLAILSVLLLVFSTVSSAVSEIEVNNLLAIGINDESPLTFMEFYNSEIDNWKALQTENINISDYGVAIYRNRLLLIGGFNNANRSLTNVVNEVDLLSGQIKTLNYLNQPRSNPSVAVVGEGKSSALYILGGKLQSKAVTATVERWDESKQEWMNVKPMISPCEGAAVVIHNDEIYVMGGFNGDRYIDTVQVYNVTSEMWNVKRPMNEVKGHFNGVSDGRYIFTIGGFADYSDPKSALNSVDRYDPENDVWVSISNTTHCSGSVGVSFLNDHLYAVGGTFCARTEIYHENNNTWHLMAPLSYDRSSHTVLKVPFELKDYEFDWKPGNRSMKDIMVVGLSYTEIFRKIEVYHPEDGSWKVMDHEKSNTSEYQAAFVNDRLIIVGGYDSDGSISNKVFEISFETGKLIPLSSMNEHRIYAPLVSIGEGKSVRLYVIGGLADCNQSNHNAVERWDPFTDTWESVSPMRIPRGRLAAVHHEGNIYAFGGYDSSPMNYNEVYLVDENRWDFRAPMKHKSLSCSAVSDGKYIYVVGGLDDVALNYVQRYDASTDTWKDLAPTTSNYMMGISLLDNSPIVFGGFESDVVEIYDDEEDEWRRLAPMNYKREIHNALQIPWKWKYSNRV